MSDEYFSGPQPETPDGSRSESPPPTANGPATASVQLVVAAWAISIVSALQGWLIGSLISGIVVLAAIPLGIWGLRRAKALRGSGKGRAIAGLATAAATLLLPIPALWYIRSVREGASLLHEKSTLSQIGLALHTQHDALGFFAPNVYDPETKRFNSGLSWRVEVLLFLESGSGFERFRLNEPWDGPTNRPLADYRMPVFMSPFDPPDTTRTRYHVFVGGGAMFEYGKQTRIDDVTDGMSNTIMIAEGRESAHWPQPFDLQYAPDQPIPPLGREDASGFSVVMGDGSARFVRKGVSEKTLRAAITAAGKDTLGPDW